MYKGLSEAVLSGKTRPASREKRIILPSSFTGGPRYMIQNSQDAMAICRVVGYPDIFLTFTFVYTIEFQKRGLPHTHILLFLHHDDKFPMGEDIDQIISAEIPDKVNDPLYYEAVEKHIMHGPCGSIRKDSPCMENGQCMRHFPKRFVASTTIDEDDYPCNQSRSIKYLFKYINKGHDRVTASFYRSATSDTDNDQCDEVSMYYDCRYISPCKATWRIFGYSIYYRNPSVVRLGFHLPGEQPVIFKDDENLDDVVRKESVKESMFLRWFEANKKYPEARSLTYVEFLSKFV
ncbi:uncharacterized protein [Arachis hypogaea]|uniref:uncharacterized protein n=1 Tax=Arachis hypogaea TaxID=3818 RepID=UPI003B2226CE